MDKRAVDKLIEEQYASLPPTLQRAARYAIDNPKAIALNSMRSVAAEAGLQSSAMHRLAIQLGFDGYEAMRTIYRDWLHDTASFSQRATALQQRGARDETESLVRELVQADSSNLLAMLQPATFDAIRAATDVLSAARHIYVVGLRSLFPAAFYFHYACGMFQHNTVLLSGTAGTFADDLRRGSAEDVMLVFSYEPYARDTLLAVRFARERGLKIVSVTDSVLSPIASDASALIVATNSTPSLFPSVLPALSIAQTLVALLVASGGRASLDEIEKSESQLREFAVYASR